MGRLIILIPFAAIAVIVFAAIMLGKGVAVAAKVGAGMAQAATDPARKWLLKRVKWNQCLRCGSTDKIYWTTVSVHGKPILDIHAKVPLCYHCQERGVMEAHNNANQFHLSVASFLLRQKSYGSRGLHLKEAWMDLLWDYYQTGDFNPEQKYRVQAYAQAIADAQMKELQEKQFQRLSNSGK